MKSNPSEPEVVLEGAGQKTSREDLMTDFMAEGRDRSTRLIGPLHKRGHQLGDRRRLILMEEVPSREGMK